MGGSSEYRIVPSSKFETTIGNLLKRRYRKSRKEKEAFQSFLADAVSDLTREPRPYHSRPEPWPRGVSDPSWELRKLDLRLPGQSGAAREGRLIYMVNDEKRLVVLVWIYTHADFEQRPPDKPLGELLKELKARESTD